jgi:hypothetical protein
MEKSSSKYDIPGLFENVSKNSANNNRHVKKDLCNS